MHCIFRLCSNYSLGNMNTKTYTTKWKKKREITIMETDHYVVVKIPREMSEQAKHKKKFSDFVGALADVPEFKGKTSVEVQHMIKDIWSKHVMEDVKK
jgi:hypothetical protein